MRLRRHHRNGIAWLETLLAIAILALLFQLIPRLGSGAAMLLDVRYWSRSTWFLLNLFVVLTMIAVRFGPDAGHAWQERQSQRRATAEKKAKQLALKEQRETLERIKQGRSRRVI